MKVTHNNIVNELIEDCKAGKRTAQQKLYDILAGKMFAVCLRYAKDRMTAEDILQMSFVKVFGKIWEFQNDGTLEGWVRRIVVNTAIEAYRKTVRQTDILAGEAVMENVVDESVFDQLQMADLLDLINSLPDGYRIVFNMYVIEGYSHKEIAAILGITEGGSKSQLSRARRLLQVKIKKQETVKYVDDE